MPVSRTVNSVRNNGPEALDVRQITADEAAVDVNPLVMPATTQGGGRPEHSIRLSSRERRHIHCLDQQLRPDVPNGVHRSGHRSQPHRANCRRL